MSLVSGYELVGLQTEPGICTGEFAAAWVSPIAWVLTYTCSQDMLYSGLRNQRYCCFAAATPLNEQGSQEVPWFWKNKTLPKNLVGGFQLNEKQAHYKLSKHHQHVVLMLDRSALMAQLDQPQNRTVLEYMMAANSCVLPEKVYWDFIHYVLIGAFLPGFARYKPCPILAMLDVLNDGSYAHALPSAQMLPSAVTLLEHTRTIKKDILAGMNVEQLGNITGLGRTQLNAACKEAYSCTPKEFIRSVRMEEAMLLLRSPGERSYHGLSTITDIHNFVGTPSSSAFRKSFGDYYLDTPKSFWVD